MTIMFNLSAVVVVAVAVASEYALTIERVNTFNVVTNCNASN